MTNKIIPFVDLFRTNIKYKKKFLKITSKIIEKSNFIKGKNNLLLEKSISNIFKRKYVLTVNSGTDALLAAVKALELKKNDEVIMTSNTWISAAYAIALNNLKPVFVDIDEDNLQMDIKSFKDKINNKTKGCIITHLYGFPNKMDEILKICKKNKIKIIEDLAQSHLASYKNKLVGTFGDISILSFYPTKNLGALGDGGAVITNKKNLFNRCKIFLNYGSLDFRDANHKSIGINSRMDELQAAFLFEKLKNLKKDTKTRIKLAKIYNFYCDKIGIKRLITKKEFKNVYHLYPIIINNRDNIQKILKKNNIKTQIHYKLPIHLQKAFKYLNYKKNSLPVTERISKKILSLPFFVGITNNEIKKIFKILNEVI